MVRQTMLGKCGAQQLTKAALYAVAHHGIADLLGNGNAVAFALAAIGVRQKHETGARHAQTPVRCKKIRAATNHRDFLFVSRCAQAQSFLRPRFRRARRTLRPPTVALRAKNPWRRLRTRLLGWNVRFIGSSSIKKCLGGAVAPIKRAACLSVTWLATTSGPRG